MGNSAYSEGSRSGRIVQFSQSGFFWKTYEGEMICDGMKERALNNGEHTSIANTWRFSINAKGENIEKLAEQIRKKMDDGQPVKLDYRVPYIRFPCQGSTCYFIKDVK